MSGTRQILRGFYERVFIKLFFFAASLSLLSFSAVGQDKTEAFKKIIAEAYKKLESVPYRLQTDQRASNGFSGLDVTQTYEFAAPGKTRKKIVTTEWSDVGTDIPRQTQQVIELGKKRYVKFDNENWKEMTAEDEKRMQNENIVINIYFQLKDFSFATKNLSVTQYAITPDNQQIYRAFYTADKRDYEVFYWINPKGFLIKTEWKVNFKYNVLKMTELYEYDADIKIEIPKLN